ncbi:hypothetical protein RIF23_11065 [Lipingzhangella sp. LS1_29]|uniref:Uncharacterized protein n=1 Tax=Lipingzhangella rawalii TaxID=2055835 RepID=A0ABU2H6B4_9ACTN|nr:hypothetical protein [Lipingzhangella rawalii]MDS1270841.1 hypothetical protein [Lipingzhangella rawalii]
MSIEYRQKIDEHLRKEFGSSVKWNIRSFDSGSIAITIQAPSFVAVLDGAPEGEWGVSVDPDESEAFTGHHDVVESFSEAIDIIHATLNQR